MGKVKKILVSAKGLPFRLSSFILCKKISKSFLFSWFFWLFSTRTSTGLRSGVSTTSQRTLDSQVGSLHVTRDTGTSDKSSLERRFKLKGRRGLNRTLTYGHTKLTLDTFCLSFFRKKHTKMSQFHPFNASREANKFQEHCPLRGSPSQPGHWGRTPVRGFWGLFCSPQHPHTHTIGLRLHSSPPVQ